VGACVADCVQVIITNAPTTAKPGDTVTVGVTFKQAPTDGKSGGPDEIAALAMTLGIPGSTEGGMPLALVDAPNCVFSCVGGVDDGKACTMNPLDCQGGQCQGPSVHPDASIAGLTLAIENASCAGGRTHCLCPDAGQVQDNFINLVVFGPNPLPTPGPTPIVFPTLPAGPQLLATIDLKVLASASAGTVPLHVFNQVQDATPPQFHRQLSVGDTMSVDQTCVPMLPSPPCSDPAAVSQVATTDGSIMISSAQGCACDCNGDNRVTGSEITRAVLILGGARQLGDCTAADSNHDGRVTGSDITRGVLALGAGTACVPQ
jgi:hypothetical protein